MIVLKNTLVCVRWWQDVYEAFDLGIARYRFSRKMGLRHKYGAGKMARDDMILKDCLGALGELAFARLARLEWARSINSFGGEPDVLPDWQVRTRMGQSSELVVRKSDSDDQKFVLITLDDYSLDVVFRGWILGGDAKVVGTVKEFRDEFPVFVVPQRMLLDLECEPPPLPSLEEWKKR